MGYGCVLFLSLLLWLTCLLSLLSLVISVRKRCLWTNVIKLNINYAPFRGVPASLCRENEKLQLIFLGIVQIICSL
uniref:Putative secreted protein n=1 Tax=Panstrongylus lignarius TaxID=156445 RepID=A0A224Y5R0_9HEMI